jgi:putative oxidoreductase
MKKLWKSYWKNCEEYCGWQMWTKARIDQSDREAFADLFLRVFFGLALAFAHGFAKVPPSAQFIEGVTGMGFPLPDFFAWAASLAEFAGGLLLAAGFVTRGAAVFIAINMIVAVFLVHGADPFQKKELALMYLFIALYYKTVGAGRFSLDAVLFKQKKK